MNAHGEPSTENLLFYNEKSGGYSSEWYSFFYAQYESFVRKLGSKKAQEAKLEEVNAVIVDRGHYDHGGIMINMR